MTDPLTSFDLDALARRQLRDYDRRCPGTMFADPTVSVSLSLDQAYAIQAAVSELRKQRDDPVIGYKIGCTSPEIQAQLGINHPIRGRLFGSERWTTGATFSWQQFDQLGIEGELAVRLADDLPDAADLSSDQLWEAIESVFAVIELHHFVIRRPQPSAEEMVANNAIHAGFVASNQEVTPQQILANSNAGYRLQIAIDDEVVAAVNGDWSETVLASLRWLANAMAAEGQILTGGQTMLCGSVAKLIPMARPGRVVVTADPVGRVECTIDP